jgi:hypothetical protein
MTFIVKFGGNPISTERVERVEATDFEVGNSGELIFRSRLDTLGRMLPQHAERMVIAFPPGWTSVQIEEEVR